MSFKLTKVGLELFTEDEDSGDEHIDWKTSEVEEGDYDRTLYDMMDDVRKSYGADMWFGYELWYCKDLEDDVENYIFQYNSDDILVGILHDSSTIDEEIKPDKIGKCKLGTKVKDVLHLDPANIPFNVFCVPTT